MSRRTCKATASPRRQRGVGLIEVLIAVLVVSIGFLGVAALQVMTLSTNNSAMAHSMATISTYSMLDAMRIDRGRALAGGYNGTVVANSCASISAPSTLATAQLKNWCTQLGHNLGAASTTTGTINCTGTSTITGYCTVTIAFSDDRSGVGVGDDASGITTITTKAEL